MSEVGDAARKLAAETDARAKAAMNDYHNKSTEEPVGMAGPPTEGWRQNHNGASAPGEYTVNVVPGFEVVDIAPILQAVQDDIKELKVLDDGEERPTNHYSTKSGVEVIDIIEGYELPWNLANAVKYVARCERKGNKVGDIRKAMWYLQRELNKEESGDY